MASSRLPSSSASSSDESAPTGTPSPEQVEERAAALLRSRFGAAPGRPITTAFTHGAISLLSEHTHYTDGFALLTPVQQGTAVALRRAEGSSARIAFPETASTNEDPRAYDDPEPRLDIVRQVLRAETDEATGYEGAVITTVPPACRDGYWAALAVATARVVFQHREQQEPAAEALENRPDRWRALIEAATGWPYSVAYPIGALHGDPSMVHLVDTKTGEHLPVESPARTAMGWGLIDTREPPPYEASEAHDRRASADEALDILRATEFDKLDSFRELEHRTLPRALDALPAHLRPVAQHLVTENRRVQKLVAALRRTDWQMAGALLLMSHASRRDNWRATTPAADAIVAAVDEMTQRGVYGACMTSRGGAITVVSRRAALATGLEACVARVTDEFEHSSHALVV